MPWRAYAPRMSARTRLLPLVPLLAAALALSGCSGVQDPTPERTAAASQSGQDGPALRAALADIDPALDTDASIDAGEQVCLDIQEGQDDATVTANARKHFADVASDLSDQQVAQIVEAVKTQFCR